MSSSAPSINTENHDSRNGGYGPDIARLVMELRRNGVRDRQVLEAIEHTPREAFMTRAFRHRAYEDSALPIASGQTISQPTVVGWMTQALELSSRLRVLEIGTGSGYQAAILSRLCRMVYSIERHKSLLAHAESVFRTLNLENIHTRCGDGSKGWPEAAPFDRIIVTAAAESVPPALTDQLIPGGILVIPVGSQSEGQSLLRIRKQEDGSLEEHTLMGVRFVPLVSE